MQPQKVWAVYFSGTGTTEKTVRRIASSLAAAFSAPLEAVDFTAPAVRKEALTFGPDDLVVLGTPTYAGRVPNVLLPYLTEQIRGAATPAVPVVLFGNRDFDDALIELAQKPDTIGFLLPAMEKSQLFRGVIADGVLPRKTFSMGHSREKRYYLEGRKIK